MRVNVEITAGEDPVYAELSPREIRELVEKELNTHVKHDALFDNIVYTDPTKEDEKVCMFIALFFLGVMVYVWIATVVL